MQTEMTASLEIGDIAREMKLASPAVAATTVEIRNAALAAIKDSLSSHADEIFSANANDLAAAEANGIAPAIVKRLKFDQHKLDDVIAGISDLIGLPDPIGSVLLDRELDEGLRMKRISCPIGVIGVIFESRPDALVQISTLCLKSGNAAVLKGGSEALNTNRELARVIAAATEKAGIPANWLQLLETRADVNEMLALDDYIDLIIPRGSNAFVKYIMTHTNIAVMGHAEGLCHVYVDAAADIEMARKVVVDSKTQYVSVCNAAETLLVHEKIAPSLLPLLANDLREKNVKLLGCEKTRAIVDMEPATEADWDTEYLDYILSIKIVHDEDEAIAHINKHGSGHTEVIVTSDDAAAEKFMSLVDAADVFWNCSSRFADGFRFGLGAEVGISTNKIHARGPVGLEGLVIYKWLLKGHGDIVADYAEGRKHFTHRPL